MLAGIFICDINTENCVEKLINFGYSPSDGATSQNFRDAAKLK